MEKSHKDLEEKGPWGKRIKRMSKIRPRNQDVSVRPDSSSGNFSFVAPILFSVSSATFFEGDVLSTTAKEPSIFPTSSDAGALIIVSGSIGRNASGTRAFSEAICSSFLRSSAPRSRIYSDAFSNRNILFGFLSVIFGSMSRRFAKDCFSVSRRFCSAALCVVRRSSSPESRSVC